MKSLLPRFFQYAAIAVVFFILGWVSLQWSESTFSNPRNAFGCGNTVLHVIDGDTFELASGEDVRLIGVDAPELNADEPEEEFFAREAKSWLANKIKNREVCLEKGNHDNKDKYDRLLRYVKIDGELVNVALVEGGYARVYTRFPFQHSRRFSTLEKNARENERGLWNEDERQAFIRQAKEAQASKGQCGGSALCPENALDHLGEQGTVHFFIEASYNSGDAIFLNSLNNYQDPKNFTAVIFASDFGKFRQNPAAFYKNKTVQVTGTIKSYEGRAQIILENPEQIEVVN